jgi:CheY-like chemotaxis protein
MGARILVVDDSPTIRKVVASILTRHHFEPILAADGLEALELLGASGADLVLVDFVMPRMNGYQFCMTLRQNEALSKLPVVLMSAKGDKIRGKFVEQTGALDAITKPFDARGLVAVVESALKKVHDTTKPRSEHPKAIADEPLSNPEPQDSSSATFSAVRRLSEELAQLLRTEVKVAESSEDLAGLLERLLEEDACHAIADIVDDPDFPGRRDEMLSGDLGSISIAEILQLLDMQRKTGALQLSNRKAKVTLFIRDGLLDFATYAGLPEEFLLGRYLIETAALTRAKLDEYLDQARKSGKVLGDFLVSSGIMTEAQLRSALSSQTSELLYEVVRWNRGRFRFIQTPENSLASRAQLGLLTAGLVMEGFRRVDEWRLIEDSFDFADVLFQDQLAIEKLEDQAELTDFEKSVLLAIDGNTTVGELVDALDGSSFEICKVLYRLLNSRLVKRKSGGGDGTHSTRAGR